MTKIKICGLSRKIDIDYANASMPDYIGFVFAPGKRNVSLETAKDLKQKLNKEIKAVGVFVNEPKENIIKACNECVIDIIQLHGDEDNRYINSLREHTENPVIKAVRVKDSEDIKDAAMLASDYILFDTYSADKYGGTGKSFDWDIIDSFDRPFFLSGGINVENISSAITKCKPFCFDISSGVETYGVKDISKINDVIRLSRRSF